MIKSYLKVAFRNLWRNWTYSTLNISGLAIGIACAGLIYLWIEHEVNFDRFNEKRDRLYAVRLNMDFGGNIYSLWSTPGLLAPSIKAEIPGIKNTCRTGEPKTLLFHTGQEPIYATGLYADSSFFSMFTMPFKEGNSRDAFSQLHSVVITEKTAKKFFGRRRDVIGKTLRVENEQDYVVSGVLQDLPENSTIQFEWLIPFQVLFNQKKNLSNWTSNNPYTYVELEKQASAEAVNRQLRKYIQTKDAEAKVETFLFGLNDWHLYDQFENGKQTGGGRIEYVRTLSFIAWIILLIACINFMNLATARSEKRSREIGVRKVMGARKGSLVAQFMGEAFVMSVLAALLAIGIVAVVLPDYNRLVEKSLSLALDSPIHILALLGIIVVCTLIAGSYPSLYLSSFKPVFVLKGIKMKAGSASVIRKGLVVLQFTISIVFIISTITIYRQINHAKNRELGFNKSDLIEIEMREEKAALFPVIKQELLQTGVVQSVAQSDHPTIYGGNNTDKFTWQGKNPEQQILISMRQVSPEFIETSGMRLRQGSNFSNNTPTDSSAVIITESLAKLLGEGSAIGKIIQLPLEDGQGIKNMNVVGVVNDYLYGDVYGTPFPVVFFCTPQYSNLIYVRMKAEREPGESLAKIGEVIRKNDPQYPFTYKFVDDQFNQMFRNEMLLSKLSGTFATLAIIISCLGLFGLAAYTAERRIREIGIRKVLGASVASINILLTKDFLRLIIISALVAFPIAWWAMYNWLQGFTYRVNVGWWVFLLAGAIAMLIALITISFQSIRAALMNPVKSLRTE